MTKQVWTGARAIPAAVLILASGGGAHAQRYRLSADAVPTAPAASSAVTTAYRISPGDELAITFPYNPEIDHAGPVGPDGRMSFPLIGNVPVGGRTVDEVGAMISAELRRQGVVADARPTVAIRQYGGVVYVGGQVRTPGAVRLTAMMDPMQAVISAGGFLDTARTKKVVIIHREPDGRITQRTADLRAYTREGLPTGIDIQPQDIVFVPRSSVAEANLWIEQHIDKMLPFSRSLNFTVGNGAVFGR